MLLLACSVDGLHQVDVSNFVSKYPTSFMAKLAAKGMSYPGAKIKGLSDSFPGLLSLVTGATSGSTGVVSFYEQILCVAVDRHLFC